MAISSARLPQEGAASTAADLRVAVQRLIDRGAAQRRGGVVILQPRPIAMKLAERWWRKWCREEREEWDVVLAGDASPDLKVLAARQLAWINTTEAAPKVVRHVCRSGGPFDGVEGVSRTDHAEVLSALAEVDPEAVAGQIKRCLNDVEDLSKVEGDARRHLVWALEKIAFHPDSFEDGARLMLRLAVAENETWGNNATGRFIDLFPVLLGNTAADGNARLSVLDSVLDEAAVIQRCETACDRRRGPDRRIGDGPFLALPGSGKSRVPPGIEVLAAGYGQGSGDLCPGLCNALGRVRDSRRRGHRGRAHGSWPKPARVGRKRLHRRGGNGGPAGGCNGRILAGSAGRSRPVPEIRRRQDGPGGSQPSQDAGRRADAGEPGIPRALPRDRDALGLPFRRGSRLRDTRPASSRSGAHDWRPSWSTNQRASRASCPRSVAANSG